MGPWLASPADFPQCYGLGRVFGYCGYCGFDMKLIRDKKPFGWYTKLLCSARVLAGFN